MKGGNGEKIGRKPKKIKLEGQPKRAQSAYFIWMNANREEIKKESPSLKQEDIAKTAGELWKALIDKSVSRIFIMGLLQIPRKYDFQFNFIKE